MKSKKILDVCCGGRMFYFNKNNPNVLFCDKRSIKTTLCDGRTFEVNPDKIIDFRKLPFEDNLFRIVVFDPPHLLRVGEKSWLGTKYGKLDKDTWKEDIKKGFEECFRVLATNGILILKWSEEQIKTNEVLKLTPYEPLLGDKRGKTRWIVFCKKVE